MPANSPYPGQGAVHLPTTQAGLAWRLADFLDELGGQSSGRLTLIALDPARSHFGATWPRLAPKVHSIVDGTLRKLLSADEVCRPIDELSYVIMFRDDRAAKAAALIEEIGAEISRRIMGENHPKILVRFVHISLHSHDEGPQGESGRPGRGKGVGTSMAATASRTNNFERILTQLASEEQEFSLDQIKFISSPICSTDNFQVASYRCVPVLNDERTGRRQGYAVLPLDSDATRIAELDALTAEFAANELGSSHGQKNITIPIHRSTLASRKYRDLYIKICRGLLYHHKDRITFDIVGIEDGTPSNRVIEYVQYLKPFSSGLFATVDIGFSTMANFSGAGLVSVGTELDSVDLGGIEKKIAKFVTRTRTINLKCHIHGIPTPALSSICLALSVDYVNGWAENDEPDSSPDQMEPM